MILECAFRASQGVSDGSGIACFSFFDKNFDIGTSCYELSLFSVNMFYMVANISHDFRYEKWF